MSGVAMTSLKRLAASSSLSRVLDFSFDAASGAHPNANVNENVVQRMLSG